MNSPQKILITGASGLLGSQLIHEYLTRNIRPVCLVRESSDCVYIDKHKLEKRYADLRNQEQLGHAFEGIDTVIHTAAVVDFRGDKLTMFTGVNSFGTLFCYRAAVAAGVKTFLHVSTIAAVGAVLRDKTSPSVLLDERAEFNLKRLRIPYILSKRQAEELLRQERDSADSDRAPQLITVNPSIIVAPSRHSSDKARIDKLMSRAFLPCFLNRVNLVDIRDVAIAILEALAKGRDGERYLLTADNVSVPEALDIFSDFSGHSPRRFSLPKSWLRAAAKLAVKFRSKNRGGKLRFYPDIVEMLNYDWAYDNSKARKELGFNPRPVRETLQDLYTGDFAGSYLQPFENSP